MKMLPCPFCGAQPELEPWHGGPPTKRLVWCGNEACAVAPMVTGDTKAEAIARWNQRAPRISGRRLGVVA